MKTRNPRQWYSALKRITKFAPGHAENVIVDEIAHLPQEDQANIIAEKFASIQNEYSALKAGDIDIPEFSDSEIPQFAVSDVWQLLAKLPTNKATVPGDFPAKLIKLFAAYLAEPLSDVINTSVRRGEYPSIYKFEV